MWSDGPAAPQETITITIVQVQRWYTWHNRSFQVFNKRVTDRRTDKRTDRRTDGQTSFKDARTHLKITSNQPNNQPTDRPTDGITLLQSHVIVLRLGTVRGKEGKSMEGEGAGRELEEIWAGNKNSPLVSLQVVTYPMRPLELRNHPETRAATPYG